MAWLRTLVATHRLGLSLVLACALAARLLVPAGFMPVTVNGTVEIALCSGMAADAPAGMAMAMPDAHHGDHSEGRGGHGKSEAQCPFAGLGLAAVDAARPALLAAAIAFAFLLAARAVPAFPCALSARLRPPLRAPPRSI